MPIPKGFKRKRIVRNYRRVCAPGSVRTKISGKAHVLVCCPRGKWKTRARRCSVGLRAISIDKPTR